MCTMGYNRVISDVTMGNLGQKIVLMVTGRHLTLSILCLGRLLRLLRMLWLNLVGCQSLSVIWAPILTKAMNVCQLVHFISCESQSWICVVGAQSQWYSLSFVVLILLVNFRFQIGSNCGPLFQFYFFCYCFLPLYPGFFFVFSFLHSLLPTLDILLWCWVGTQFIFIHFFPQRTSNQYHLG